MIVRCREARFLISMQADGELRAEKMALLAEHLRSCPSCRAYSETVSRTDAFLRELLVGGQAPAGFLERVMQSLPALPAAQRLRRWERFIPALATAVIVLLVAGSWLWTSGHYQAPSAVNTPAGISAFKVPSSSKPGLSPQTSSEPKSSTLLSAAQEKGSQNAVPETATGQGRPRPPRE